MRLLQTKYIIAIVVLFVLASCERKPKEAVLFQKLNSKQTGLDFTNKLNPTDSFNMFHYMYFYNGAGVGAGDFNNDGKIDLFFTANQGPNKLYLNKGKLQFEDVTVKSKIPQANSWCTGVSVVDINNDGLLDIYICKIGNYEILHGKNELLICTGIENGIPQYKNEATEYGLDFSGFSTQAAFFDYDMDGDLDMFLLNHSVHQNGSFAPRDNFINTYNDLSGDRLYRNDGNQHFTNVTVQSKINSSAISYGLGVVVADINLDGWPDLYVGNDFHENDYLYINQKNGTFSEENNQMLMHTSQFSMGVDVADVNNDAFPEIISMDMLPSNPAILKRSLGEDDYDVFYQKISYGYNYQYTRNNLQYNRKNGQFSEVGLYSGVYATDWSWAPLWMDFDNDGMKDLFISNGIPKRMNDMDYVNYISNEEIQNEIRDNDVNGKYKKLINKFPQIKIPNAFFLNTGNLKFNDIASSVDDDEPTYSNGAVFADFDNDGDLDIVVNNIDDPVLLYQNTTNDQQVKKFAELDLKGIPQNKKAIGSKVILFAGNKIYTYEKNPVHGFQSSMEEPLHIGYQNINIDSAFLIWPDNTFQSLKIDSAVSFYSFDYKPGLPTYNYEILKSFYKNDVTPAKDITAETGLQYLHVENQFDEFNREFLIPHMVSTEGPALAVGDVNNDGLDDVFFGASKTFHKALFIQQPNGKFSKVQVPAFVLDSMYEDVDAVFADVNQDGYNDLLIAAGGNEYYGEDVHLKPRLYINDGKGNFVNKLDAFGNIFVTQSCIKPCDFNGDGLIDLFIGGRAVPWKYGVTPRSYLLQNDGTGKFTDVTAQYTKDLMFPGMVTNAVWFDINDDQTKDLLVTCEWGGVYAFLFKNNKCEKRILTDRLGWWNFILPVDLNKDGKTDFIVGNLGLNSRLQATKQFPVNLYINDFDDNGRIEQILTYYLNGKQLPFANKDEIQKQIPIIRKKFLYAEDFANATLTDIFTESKLKSSVVLTADCFENSVLINTGNMNFVLQPLPWELQLSPLRTGVAVDAKNNGSNDAFLAGNFYDNNIQMGRNDADFGSFLIGSTDNHFSSADFKGFKLRGQVRSIKPITINKQKAYVCARNNDSAIVIKFTPEKL